VHAAILSNDPSDARTLARFHAEKQFDDHIDDHDDDDSGLRWGGTVRANDAW
jgi:hypothetical protein